MDIPCTPEPAVLPFLRPWSRNRQNRCEYGEILSYWTAHDAITFLLDLGAYRPALYEGLTNDEAEHALQCKPPIARRRFVLSRTILKRILSEILSEERAADIILTRESDGRVHVKDRPQVFVSLSYSGAIIAVTVGKRKLGSDIEGVRPIRDRRITASPIFQCYRSAEGTGHVQQVIHLWTLVESYAKLNDTNPYPLLNRPSPFTDADFVSYCIDRRAIFSLASAQNPASEVLVWLDI